MFYTGWEYRTQKNQRNWIRQHRQTEASGFCWCKVFLPGLMILFCRNPLVSDITTPSSPKWRMTLTSTFENWTTYKPSMGFPGGSDGKESACNAEYLGLIPGLGRSHWRREWLSTPVFLPGKCRGQKSMTGYYPWGHKESDTTEWLTLSLWLPSPLHISLK